MIAQDVIMIVTSDVSGQVRGKGFPGVNLEKRLKRGVGWVPTNVQITCFNEIADSPYGSTGDLILVPDEQTKVKIDFQDNGPIEHFYIGNILHMDGTPWDCCTRGLAQKALDDLDAIAGLRLFSTFEHEFFYTGADQTGWNGFSLDCYRQNSRFAQTLAAALEQAGVETDTILPEYGPGQFEVTVSPATGVRSADQSLILREVARATAARFNERVSFSPVIRSNAVGNGVHIHFSLLDRHNTPVTYDPKGRLGLSRKAGMFCAGICKYMPSITALMAAGVLSYERLTPHKWSAAFNNLAVRDREAGLRICPVVEIEGHSEKIASQFNLEYRAADACASPYLQLAALVRAGLQGIKDELPVPDATQEDLSLVSDEKLTQMGIVRLPQSLDQALELFRADPMVNTWFPKAFRDIYVKHKSHESGTAASLGQNEIYEQYARLY